VLSVSDDAVPLEKGGLVYTARVSMDRATIQVQGKAGQSLTWHGRERRDQNRGAPDHRVSAEPTAQVGEGESAGAVKKHARQ